MSELDINITMDDDRRGKEFINDHHPDDEKAYWEERAQAIESGKLTWAARNLDTDRGRTYDVFIKNTHRGFVDEDDGFFVTYFKQDERSEPRAILETEDILTAVYALERILHEED